MLTVLIGLGLAPCLAMAEDFPDRPVTIVVPFAPGSRTDQVARTLGNELAPLLKQPVVVENRSGANQIVGGSYVARAPANGYTLLMVTLPSVNAPSIQKTLPYQSLADFAPVATLVKGSGMLVIGADVPASNLKEFIALLKANPGNYAYGSGGNGSPLHLVIEMFNDEAGTSAINVPYKSVNSIMMDIIAGHIQFGYVTLAGMQFVNTGKLKALGVTSRQRNPAFPDLPTIQEAGLKGFEYAAAYAIVAPKGTPADVVQKLNSAINSAIASEGFKSKMRPEEGLEVVQPMTPQETGALIASEEKRWNALVKARNIPLE